jgi:hypothetical protein
MRNLRKTRISTVIASIVMLISMLFPVASTSAAGLKTATPAHVASLSPELSVSSHLDLRRYVTSGDRAYELGSEDGRYPAMGFHTRGEMGGIWSPPIKLLDGIWFGINGQWIGPATSFTSGFGYVQMAILYPSLRVKFAQGKREVVGDFPPRALGPVRMEAENLQIHRDLCANVAAESHRLTKFRAKCSIGPFKQ